MKTFRAVPSYTVLDTVAESYSAALSVVSLMNTQMRSDALVRTCDWLITSAG